MVPFLIAGHILWYIYMCTWGQEVLNGALYWTYSVVGQVSNWQNISGCGPSSPIHKWASITLCTIIHFVLYSYMLYMYMYMMYVDCRSAICWMRIGIGLLMCLVWKTTSGRLGSTVTPGSWSSSTLEIQQVMQAIIMVEAYFSPLHVTKGQYLPTKNVREIINFCRDEGLMLFTDEVNLHNMYCVLFIHMYTNVH